MKRLLVTSILLIVIVVSFAYVVVKAQSLGPDDNYFNQNLRARFAEHEVLRSVFALHFPGDARADYLGDQYGQILIEVDLMATLDIRAEALDRLEKELASLTGKETRVLISDNSIPYQNTLSLEDIDVLAERYRNFFNSKDRAVIYVLYVSQSAEDLDFLGITHREQGMVLFGETMRRFTEQNPGNLYLYELSTALHEFGHLLGLPHNQEPGCIMNEEVEIRSFGYESPNDIVKEFCEFELSQI